MLEFKCLYHLSSTYPLQSRSLEVRGLPPARLHYIADSIHCKSVLECKCLYHLSSTYPLQSRSLEVRGLPPARLHYIADSIHCRSVLEFKCLYHLSSTYPLQSRSLEVRGLPPSRLHQLGRNHFYRRQRPGNTKDITVCMISIASILYQQVTTSLKQERS